VAISGRFGGLYAARRPRLNFNKTRQLGTPADQLDFSRLPRRAVVAGDDDVTQAAQMEVSVRFAAPLSRAESLIAFA